MEVLRKYGVATTISFPLVAAGDASYLESFSGFSAGEVQISKDEAGFSDTTNDPVDLGNGIYTLDLETAEMQAARIVITIKDNASTNVWEPQTILIATYGNAAAQHAFDLDDADGTTLTEAGGDGDHLTEAGGTGDHLTALPWNNAVWDYQIQSEVEDAFVVYGLDHLISASVTGTDIADDSIVARLVSASTTADWDDFDNLTDSLQALRDDLPRAILPQQNIAYSNIEFLMVLASDHATPATGLTIAATRSIDGGAFASATGTAAEVSNGVYQFDASAADMNGSIITFRFTGTDADDTFVTVRTTS